ncbi:MAG: helix-turn-helix domain-containing protein [Prevotellaceae bacterium]|jgi:transcriptional regulator with XRE-family HTH domain|nr:helix-turn-helix domain-containing protein [Prevotellaceae bacterium]
MKDRIVTFLNAEKLSPARFADIIGVQPANISHIISERNKPSLDFIQKMLKAFPKLNVEWLITGYGNIYKDSEINSQTIFTDKNDSLFAPNIEIDDKQTNDYKQDNLKIETADIRTEILSQKNNILPETETKSSTRREVERIIICYSDKTFEFYCPQ